MGEFIVDNVVWKKGEQGLQNFILYESDGITRRNGTGKTYQFNFWKKGTTTLSGGGALVAINAPQGEYYYIVLATDTDTIDDFIGELIEDPGSAALRSETFDVDIKESSNFS